MKRKRRTMIITTVLMAILACGVVYAMQEIIDLSSGIPSTQEQQNPDTHIGTNENDSKKAVIDEHISEQLELFELEDILKIDTYNEDDIIKTTEKYVNYSVMFDMTSEESSYINELVNSGYDCEKVLDIYAFIQYAKLNLSDIPSIYSEGEKTDFDSKFWVEDAYEKYMGISPLTKKEIALYVHSGLSVGDILYAYKFSLGGSKTIQEILEMRQQDVNWIQIINETHNCDIGDDILMIDENPEVLYNMYIMSLKTGKNFKDCIYRENDALSLTDEVKTVFMDKVKSEKDVLEKYGYTKPINEYVKEAIEREFPDMSDDAISAMVEDGYRIRDIKSIIESTEISTDIENKEIQKYIETTQKERE